MRRKEEVTQADLDLCEKVKTYLRDTSHKLHNLMYNEWNATITCDKDDSFRIKDFCIEFPRVNNYWFRTHWSHMNSHLNPETVLELNRILSALKYESKALGITNISRRGFGIIFDARKR